LTSRHFVEIFSKPGDLMCDPFLGGGTTAIAARTLGRGFIGADNGEDEKGRAWMSVTLERVQTPDPALDAWLTERAGDGPPLGLGELQHADADDAT
jgi:DNA methylase